VDAGLNMYDGLVAYPGDVMGTVVGFARSMGAIILQACTRRFCLPHSKILIHHISQRSVTLDTMRSAKKMNETFQRSEASQNRLYRILAARTGKKLTTITRVCARDENMNAEEALAFGLIDEITPLQRPEKPTKKI
jgi:ATP-dependent Clp protease protease subunit